MSRKVWLTATAVGLVAIATTAVVLVTHQHPSPPVHWEGMQTAGYLNLSRQTVENPTPVDDRMTFGWPCDALNGAIRAVAEDGKRLLVRFTPMGNDEEEGNTCPAGTLFFISKGDFRDLQHQAEAQQWAAQEEAVASQRQKAHVRLLLAHVQMLLKPHKQ